MRTVSSFMAAVLLMGVFALTAVAQQAPGGDPGPAVQQGAEKQMTPEQFTALKSRILKMIDARKTKLDEEKACVEAAKTPGELKKCRPHHPMRSADKNRRGPVQQPPMEQQK